MTFHIIQKPAIPALGTKMEAVCGKEVLFDTMTASYFDLRKSGICKDCHSGYDHKDKQTFVCLIHENPE